ncbi:uncharacterized protein LOC109720614 [Ananas comosus]|uniref:Uncharacterized protein LOC109720614 n=1 Tax=Ananas comosus TaxID=4615 RepID=A0A6P5G558_ANACO|nr:uncharacterized protein LOC109720614 [Ananas comosus]
MRKFSAPPFSSSLLRFRSSYTTSPPPPPPQTLNLKPVPPHLSEPYLAEVRSLLPRLLALGHHSDAVRLLSAALLLSPPLSSLPIPSLARHLSSLPDLAPTLALLTSLRHHPLRPSPLPFVAPLLSSFLLSRRPRDAAKVFFWLCRADSPRRPDREVYEIAIGGFCRLGRMLDALRALREMALDSVPIGGGLREEVYRGLLQEARIDEARELDAALKGLEGGGGEFDRVAELLDRFVRDWEE